MNVITLFMIGGIIIMSFGIIISNIGLFFVGISIFIGGFFFAPSKEISHKIQMVNSDS